MTTGRLAYAAEEQVLLTFDRATLLASDPREGLPKWQLSLPGEIVGVVFGAPNVLPHSEGSWRVPASGNLAFAVEVEGRVHVVDVTNGKLVATAPAPSSDLLVTAVASGLGTFAIATQDRVFVWRNGEASQHEASAVALAFSADGRQLALGTKNGDVIVLDVEKNEIAFAHALRGTPHCIEFSGDLWVAGTSDCVFVITRDAYFRRLDGAASAIAIDAATKRIAVASHTRVDLYDWHGGIPTKKVRARVDIKSRAIDDIAYGPNGLLGVALARGDAAIADEQRLLGIRAEPHPGRARPTWQVLVAEVKPRPLDAPLPLARTTVGSLVAVLGVTMAIGWLHLHANAPTPPAWKPAPAPWTPPPDFLKGLQCDETCEKTRLSQLARACKDQLDAPCASDADAAMVAFEASHCSEVHASLTRIQNRIRLQGPSVSTLPKSFTSLALMGLGTSCHEALPELDAGRGD